MSVADEVRVAEGVLRVPLSIVNVYAAGPPGAGDRGWVLVDAGLSLSRAAIVAAAAEAFGPDSRPAAIVLTHAHFDHVGSLQALAEAWDAPVFAHELELPYLTGRADYPPPDPAVGGGAMAWLSPLDSRRGIDLGWRVHPLPENGSVPSMPGWRWIHTPGHMPGHVAFFRDSDRALIAGDAFVTTKQESFFAAAAAQAASGRRRRRDLRPVGGRVVRRWQAARRDPRRDWALVQGRVRAGPVAPGVRPGSDRHAPGRVLLHHRPEPDPFGGYRPLLRSLEDRNHVPRSPQLFGPGDHARVAPEDRVACRPCLLGLYSVVAVLFHALPESKRVGAVSWPGKTIVTSSDALCAVRRWL